MERLLRLAFFLEILYIVFIFVTLLGFLLSCIKHTGKKMYWCLC